MKNIKRSVAAIGAFSVLAFCFMSAEDAQDAAAILPPNLCPPSEGCVVWVAVFHPVGGRGHVPSPYIPYTCEQVTLHDGSNCTEDCVYGVGTCVSGVCDVSGFEEGYCAQTPENFCSVQSFGCKCHNDKCTITNPTYNATEDGPVSDYCTYTVRPVNDPPSPPSCGTGAANGG